MKLLRKLLIRKQGIPLMYVLYKPWKAKPNVNFKMHPNIKRDEYLKFMFTEIADDIRTKYGDGEGL